MLVISRSRQPISKVPRYKGSRRYTEKQEYFSGIPLSDMRFSSRILRMTGDTLEEIVRIEDKAGTLNDLITMMERDPVARSCAELKALRATTSFGRYKHSNTRIQDWVQGNIESMEGNLNLLVGQLCSAMPLGFAVGEVLFDSSLRREWRLKGINILDPRRVSFEGLRSGIKYVIYRDNDGNKKRIPYSKCVHVVSGYTTNFNDPFGSPEAKRAYPYYQAKKTVLAEMTIAAKNNATGFWIGFTDSNDKVELLGPNGQPLKDGKGNTIQVSAPQALAQQLRQLENSSVLVTDIKNRVEPRQLSAGEQFWNLALMFLNQSITQAFHLPASIFNESHGLFGGDVAETHKSVLDATIESTVHQIKDELLNKAFRPLIQANFGEYRELGDFTADVKTDPQTKSALLQNIIAATSMQLVPSDDPDVVNKVRELLDLPLKTSETLQDEALSTQQLQGATQQAYTDQQDPNQFGAYAGLNTLPT